MLKRFISEYRASILLFVVLTGLFGSVAFETYRSKVETNSKKEAAQQGIKIDESAPIKETEPIEVQPEAPAAPTPSPTPATQRTTAPTRATTTATGCRKEAIVPYSTVYEDREYIPRGEQKTSLYGIDGYTNVCVGINGKEYARTVIPPRNALVYVGTGKTAADIEAERAQAAEIERQRQAVAAYNERVLKIQQCIRALNGAGQSLAYAQEKCESMY